MRRGSVVASGAAEVRLDPSGCLNLQQILKAFNSTISEEHAWALFYQAARCFQKCLADGATCYLFTEPKQLFLHKDGLVHQSTLLNPGDDSSSEEVVSEQQYYNEYKSKLLKKIKAEKREINATGGGPAKKFFLTPIQERLYGILGHDVGDPLPGVRHNPLTQIPVNMTEALVTDNNNLTYIEEVVNHGSPIVIPMSQEIREQEPVVAENSAELVSPTRPRRRRRARPRPQQPHSQESTLEAVQVTLSDIELRNAEATLAHAAATDRLAAAIEKMAERLANPIEIIVIEKPRLVVNLALVIYHALDYTQAEDEERLISPDLEGLITEMTSCDIGDDDDECGVLSEESETSEGGRADTDDEGIERDSEPAPRRRRRRRRFMLRDVVERCVWHCGGGGRCAREAAAAHYRAVCRALVAEALELASFLVRVKVGGARDLGAAEDSALHLDTLQFSDWARFWMQVIGELRMGVKLKKVNYSHTPIEYEMTPYEILMDDIRSRRYTLRKVDGAIPHNVKKDAHAMILEFIRSRPPLKKASERKLPPRRRETTPREQLLASIQVGRPLRRTPYSSLLSTGQGSGAGGEARRGGDVTPHAQPQRRLIKVDFDNLEDDEDDDDTETCISPEVCAPQPFPRHIPSQQTPKPWKRTEAAHPPRAPPRARISHDEYHQFCDEALESYDLATQCPSRRASMRRHTVTHVHPPCQSNDGALSVPHSRPGSRTSCAGAASLASSDDAQLSWSRTSLQDELVQSKQWQDAIISEDRLSLTLEEIVHIRSVLTKAELEVLPVEGRVKEDVEKRRVCFLCLKTRFGIFGPWGQKCKLCKKTVCQKCCSKMRIPTEHFAAVPVVLLSPSLLPSPEDEPYARLHPSHNEGGTENSVGSAPSSPALRRRAAASAPGSRGASALGCHEPAGPDSMPVDTYIRRARFSRSTTGVSVADRLRGVQMAVCHDCKAMVLQIIKSSRASRSAERDRALRLLTLDLAPVYTADC